MLKFLSTFAIIGGLTFGLIQATAYSEPVSKNAAKKTSIKKTESAYADHEQPDITKMASSLYNCELGNKLAIFHNVNDNGYVALRWQNRLHRLLRVKTSTGADRFENQKNGLVWISIPSKGMLLDSNKGRQLANECKTKHQMKLASK